jgi:hypothetical protein
MADPIDSVTSQPLEVSPSRSISRASQAWVTKTVTAAGPEPRGNTDVASQMPSGSKAPLTPEQVCRWAELIASGEGAFPDDPPSDDHQRLAAEVRRLLRARLLAFIAGAIARDINDGDSGHGRTHLQSRPRGASHDSAPL